MILDVEWTSALRDSIPFLLLCVASIGNSYLIVRLRRLLIDHVSECHCSLRDSFGSCDCCPNSKQSKVSFLAQPPTTDSKSIDTTDGSDVVKAN